MHERSQQKIGAGDRGGRRAGPGNRPAPCRRRLPRRADRYRRRRRRPRGGGHRGCGGFLLRRNFGGGGQRYVRPVRGGVRRAARHSGQQCRDRAFRRTARPSGRGLPESDGGQPGRRLPDVPRSRRAHGGARQRRHCQHHVAQRCPAKAGHRRLSGDQGGGRQADRTIRLGARPAGRAGQCGRTRLR